MVNNMMELSLEEMKTIDGAGLLGSIGQVVILFSFYIIDKSPVI